MNNAKSFTDNAMGEVGVLELADNLPSFEEHLVYHAIVLDHLDLDYRLNNLVTDEPKRIDKVDLYIE
jgi:3-oxoacyl-[acyl-carrier-protein] synthase II